MRPRHAIPLPVHTSRCVIAPTHRPRQHAATSPTPISKCASPTPSSASPPTSSTSPTNSCWLTPTRSITRAFLPPTYVHAATTSHNSWGAPAPTIGYWLTITSPTTFPYFHATTFHCLTEQPSTSGRHPPSPAIRIH